MWHYTQCVSVFSIFIPGVMPFWLLSESLLGKTLISHHVAFLGVMVVIIQVQSSDYAGNELKQGLRERQRSVSPDTSSIHLPPQRFNLGRSHLSLIAFIMMSVKTCHYWEINIIVIFDRGIMIIITFMHLAFKLQFMQIKPIIFFEHQG